MASNSLISTTQKVYPASLLLKFDGSNNSTTFTDSSTYSHTGTAYGNAKISTTQSKFGGSSGYFDGTGDYVEYPTNAVFNFGTGDFTVEAWIYLSAASSSGFYIASANGSGGFFFGFENSTKIGWGRAAVAWDYSVESGITTNKWYHVAVCRSGTEMKLFVDGFQVGTTQTNSTSYDISTGNLAIGSQNNGYFFNGYIDDVRIVKGFAVYADQYSPPLVPLSKNATLAPKTFNHIVMISTKSSGDITGYVSTDSGYYTINWYDGTKTTYSSGSNFAKIAVGGSQYITIYPSLSNGNLSGKFYSVDISNNELSSVRAFYAKFITTAGIQYPGYNNTWFYWYNYPYTGWNRTTYVPGPYVPGTRYNLNICSNNLTDTALNQLYTDLLTGTGSIDVSDNTGSNSDDPTIATAKGYTVYGSLAPIVSALFNFDGANNGTTFTDSSSYGHVPTRYGNTVTSTAQSKFGGASAYFDGTGDYLAIATNSVFAMGYEDFTVECWVRPTSWPTSDLGAIVENRTSSISGGFLLWLGSDHKWVLYTSANSNGTQRVVSSIDDATLNVWTHLVGTRKNGKLYLFVNGSLVGTTGTEGSPDDLSPSNTSQILIGTACDSAGSTRMLYGYVDALKIVKGKSLYVDDFVVPSSAPTTSTATVSSGATRLLLNCNGTNNSTTFTDSSSDARTVTRTNTVISTTQSKFGGASAYFSNSGTDALAVTNNFNLSNTDYTIEFFFYLINQSGATGNQRFFSIESSNGQSFGVLLYQTTPNFASYNLYGTSTGVDLNNTSFSYATWYHFAMSKDYNTYRFFLDGSLIGSGAGSYTPTGNVVLTIGGSRLNYQYNKLNAYMDDFRVITGKALYTSNFTPPTSQLTTYP